MKLLLHVCCAPCLIHPKEQLSSKGFKVRGFFYNPNIHPYSEYKNRREALKELDTDIVYSDYDFENFFRTIVNNETVPGRCKLCWQMRLTKTAQFAKENGFEYFSSTLLVSPYQDIDVIKEIGETVAKETGVKFYFEDFRPGFRDAHKRAKEKGVYCQKYCGCIYSEKERYESGK